MDGQEALWDARRAYLSGENAVEVLDLLHVTPRLWEAAHLFHPEGSADAVAFVRERLERVLRGQVTAVVRGFRQMGARRRLAGAKRKLHAARDPRRASALDAMRADPAAAVAAVEEVNRVTSLAADLGHFEAAGTPSPEVMTRVREEIACARRADATLGGDTDFDYLTDPD